MQLRTFASLLAMASMTVFPTMAQAGEFKIENAWTLAEGLAKPESVVYDEERDVLYVSNINGKGREKNGLGYIAQVSPSGKVVQKDWVGGLNAPKGMAMANGKLYVADIDALVIVDVASGKVASRHDVSGAKFLNDVAIDQNGAVYVSDSKTSRIHVFKDGKVSVWLDDPRIRRANGLYALPNEMIVAAGDSETKKPHKNRYLQRVSYDGKNIAPLKDKQGLGRIDGVVPDGKGGFFMTVFKAGKLMHFSPSKGASEIAKLGKGTADLTYVASKKRLYVPVMGSNELKALTVN